MLVTIAKSISRSSLPSRSARCFSSITASPPLIRVIKIPENKLLHHSTKTPQFSASFSTITKPSVKQEEPQMFCRQCEQTQDGIACTTVGVCGKNPETSAIQDTLIQVIKCVSIWANSARDAGATAEDMKSTNKWTLRAAFSTLTNVNFSPDRIEGYIHEGMLEKTRLMDFLQERDADFPPEGHVTDLHLPSTYMADELGEFGKNNVGVLKRSFEMGDEDAFSLNEIATYGAKGVCAYACHAMEAGQMDEEGIMSPLHQVWAKLASNEPDASGLLATALRVGEINEKTMALLDSVHNDSFGTPEPTEVTMTAVKGKAILISGHDMMDCKALLEQSEGKGVNVYTHGEMLPAHMYPELKKHPHLVGNYGTAWQAQKFEFATFPGPVVVTTNCIIPTPRKAYRDRLYTVNETAVDGVKHILNRDFSKVIAQAQDMNGFKLTVKPKKTHTVGFNHRVVLPLAAQLIDAIKQGDLSRIFLIGGCDGTEWDRSYFTNLAEETPPDSLILTLGCAKNRVIHSDKLRDAKLSNGMPRVMDMGQCNDSYSAVVVALELAKALDCGVNDLPLSLAISHLEQKAAAVFLTLLHLGVKNVRLGPRLPAYITPNVLRFLEEDYNLMVTGDFENDLELMMQGK